MKHMQSVPVASYPCRIERGAPDSTIAFRDVPGALACARGVPGVFEAAESALVAALEVLQADADGLPAASAPAPGEIVITVRLGGPPLVRTRLPEPPAPEPAAEEEEDDGENLPAITGEVVDPPTETGLVTTRRRGGFLARLFGWLTGSR